MLELMRALWQPGWTSFDGEFGWIGDLLTTERAIASVDKLRAMRAAKGLTTRDFTVLTPLTDALTPEHYARAEAPGVTGIITMPWMFYTGPESSTAEKIDAIKRFRKDLTLDQGARG